MSENLHIVTPDVPGLADSDISQDIFMKIKAFHDAGIKVHLHSFEFGRGTSSILEKYCYQVRYYRRNSANKLPNPSSTPYCVASRSNRELVRNLFADDFPILYEGLSTTFPVFWTNTQKNKIQHLNLVRDDEKYYKNLAALTPLGLNKLTFLYESWKCKKYMNKLRQTGNLSISSVISFYDHAAPSFTDNHGSFCLYFGKLSDKENEYAALWLLENIFNEVEIPFVIAGSNPSPQLDQAAHLRLHTCLVGDPNEKELEELIKKAQIILLPSFIDCAPISRVSKSLLLGKFVLTNPKALGNSNFKEFCNIANTPDQFKEKVIGLFSDKFSHPQHQSRIDVLSNTLTMEDKLSELIRVLDLRC